MSNLKGRDCVTQKRKQAAQHRQQRKKRWEGLLGLLSAARGELGYSHSLLDLLIFERRFSEVPLPP